MSGARRRAMVLLVLLAVTAASARAEHSYVVRPGDTLTGLAGQFHTTVAALRSANHLTSDMLQVGQVLQVPGAGPGGYRIVFAAAGETLTTLAQRVARSPASLLSANPGLTADSLQPGAAISVPPADGVTVFAVGGDTVKAVAVRAGRPAAAVAAANGLQPDTVLAPGRPILLPDPSSAVTDSVGGIGGGGGGSVASGPAPAAVPEALLAKAAPSASALGGSSARVRLRELQDSALRSAILRLPSVAFSSPTFVAPLKGRISSRFGWRALSVNGNHFHAGVDLAAPMGTPVHAARDGVVVKASWGGTYGNVVFLDHGDGTQTRYAHLSRIEVHLGERVRQGDVLGLVGSTGASTGPHVHFELRFDGRAVDPLAYLEGAAAP